jgi:hypothetical protein
VTIINKYFFFCLPCEGAAGLVDIEIAEDAPDAVARGDSRAENGRDFEKESDVDDFGLETREEIRE